MNDDETNEGLFRRRLANAARHPTSPLDLRRIRRRAVIRRATAAGSVLALAAGLAAAVSVIPNRPGGPVIMAQPGEQDDASEPPQPQAGSDSPSPSPTDGSDEETPHVRTQSPAYPPTPTESPTEPRSSASPDPGPTEQPAPSPSAMPGEPSPTASEEEVDHGALLWGRKFLVVQVTEKGEVTRVPPGDDPWTTHFSSRSNGTEPSDGQVGWGWGGCIGFGAPINVSQDRLDVSEPGGRGPGCDSAGKAKDAWSRDFFVSDPYWRLEGDRLWLWSGDATVELEEDRADDGQG